MVNTRGVATLLLGELCGRKTLLCPKFGFLYCLQALEDSLLKSGWQLTPGPGLAPGRKTGQLRPGLWAGSSGIISRLDDFRVCLTRKKDLECG